MHRDLTELGDALERAVAIDIELRRNTLVTSGHLPLEHTDIIEEDPMFTTDTPSTPDSPADIVVIGRRPRRATRKVVVIGAIAVLGIGGAAAAAAVTMSSNDVSHGLPGGSAIFEGTNPSCSTSDGVVFRCTLASAPTTEVLPDYTGAAELFVDRNLDIAGGCRGTSVDGLRWTCYVGRRAVDEGILSADLLGQYSPEPGRG